jgi:hypothetical protein
VSAKIGAKYIQRLNDESSGGIWWF